MTFWWSERILYFSSCHKISRLYTGYSSDARWNWELATKPRVKFRQIWVFTAKFFKIKVFRQKSGKSVSKMHFLQRIIALLAVPPHFSPPSSDWIPPVLRYLAVNSAIWHRCPHILRSRIQVWSCNSKLNTKSYDHCLCKTSCPFLHGQHTMKNGKDFFNRQYYVLISWLYTIKDRKPI